MKLVIVESGTKCSTIKKILGNDYSVVACFGHIRTINNGLKSIDKNYNIDFTVKKSKYITALRSEIKKAEEIFLAMDDDREGEAIAYDICEVFKLPMNTKRIKFNAITKDEILKAMENVTEINMDLVNSQRTRQIVDIMVGYTISPKVWKLVNNFTLSAGRCQSPALRIIYDNQIKIENEKSQKYFKIFGTFRNIKFTNNSFLSESNSVEDFLNKSKNFLYTISITKPKITNDLPPRPLNTSALQQLAGTVLNYSPKQLMNICQSLYQ